MKYNLTIENSCNIFLFRLFFIGELFAGHTRSETISKFFKFCEVYLPLGELK